MSMFRDTICGFTSAVWYLPVDNPARCVRCGALLTKDDIGLTRKMVNRGAKDCFCLPCLAEHFQVSQQVLREKIREFRAMGCTLFT